MGRVTSENLVKKLTYVAASACLVVSVVFVLVAIVPWFYFHGYLVGYYSPLDYRMWYGMTGKPVALPHTDYIRHATVAFTALSVLLLAVSVVSLALTGKKLSLAAGTDYGASVGLVILHGLLYGYVHRAVSYDIDMLRPVLVDEVVVRTLAGVVSYEGASIKQTIVYRLALGTPLVQVVLVLAVASSTASVLLLLLRFEREKLAKTLAGAGRSLLFRLAHQSMPILLASLVMLASVFTYYPSSLAIRPQPPPATLEAPPYAYTCTALARTSRGALAYTDFEVYPVSSWTSYGGAWSSVSGIAGAKGNVLQGIDDEGGAGKASYYYYNTTLDGYTSLWIAVKTRFVERAPVGKKDQYYGMAMLNANRTRVYAVVLENDQKGVEIRSYGVTATGWARHVEWRNLPWYSSGAWYTIITRYTVSGTVINITAYFYDAGGALRLEASTTISHTNVFVPAYIGVIADGAIAQYDEFIVSMVDPRSILFTGFYTGMGLEVWNNLGELVYSGTVPGSLTLPVVTDMVLGTGTDGRMVVRYPDTYLCLDYRVPTTDAILGGDTYSLSTRSIAVTLGANKTSASITIYISSSSAFTTSARVLRLNASQTLYARLLLNSISSSTTLNLDIWLEGVSRSTNITIRNGVPVSSSTNIVQLNLGSNNNLILSGYFTATGQTATINLVLELCTVPSGGACVRYPITTVLSS